jgi:hypothetical protein
MKTIFDIAAAAHHAYQKEERRLAGDAPMWGLRSWSQLMDSEKLCWVEAARQVMAEVAAMGCSVPDAEPVSQSVAPLPAIDAEFEEEHRHAIRS